MIRKILNSKVASNASWLIGSKIVQSILGLVISMISARYLGPENYGIINYAASIASFLLPIATLGFTNVLVQEFINHPDEEGKIIGTSMFFSLLASLLSICAIWGFVSFANAGETTTIIVCVLYSLMLIAQVFEMIVYWFHAHLMAKYPAIISLIAYIVTSGYKIFLLIAEKEVFWFAISNSIDYLVIALSSYIVFKYKGGAKFELDLSVGKRMFSKSKHYIISSLMVTIFAQTDKIMINLMIDDANVGYYSAAVTCAGLTNFFFLALIDSFRPLIFNDKKDNRIDRYHNNIIRLYSLIIYLCLAQSIVMTIFSKWIILILYGDAYILSADVLRLVVWYTTFSYLGGARNIWILAENKQNFLWIINLSGAIANIVLNYILIPVMGIMGAALASLITQIFTNVIIGWIIRPISENNDLMIKSLNPKYLREMFK